LFRSYVYRRQGDVISTYIDNLQGGNFVNKKGVMHVRLGRYEMQILNDFLGMGIVHNVESL